MWLKEKFYQKKMRKMLSRAHVSLLVPFPCQMRYGYRHSYDVFKISGAVDNWIFRVIEDKQKGSVCPRFKETARAMTILPGHFRTRQSSQVSSTIRMGSIIVRRCRRGFDCIRLEKGFYIYKHSERSTKIY